MRRFAGFFLILLALAAPARSDGPADNLAESVRPVPKPGIEVPPDRRKRLETRLAALEKAIAALGEKRDPRIDELLPDVQIFHKAVHDALAYQEFFDAKELDVADELLKEGQARASDLAAGKAPWAPATGLVVRGYVSRIDGSVQPYGLVVPPSYVAFSAHRHRLDVWFHGRGETLSELNFIQSRRKQPGQFTPRDTLVLHPYGRYCNAFKFAGETDVLEAIESVRRRYRVDDERTSVRGFSMGGAACWHFAVHYADRWFAANPGAGFSETPDFLRSFQKETLEPTWYEEKLWQLYDCNDWAANLYQCPTVAYSGENDIQKQAADVMQAALARLGIDLVHVIGPKTEHSYHPEAAAEVERRLESLAEAGRDRFGQTVHFVTYTLKYNRLHWVTIDAMEEHWRRAAVDAAYAPSSSVEVRTENVTDLTLHMQPGWCPLELTKPVELSIDGQKLETPRPQSDRSWRVQLHREESEWRLGEREATGLRKRHGLQGPIDDALMDSFVFVRPSGTSRHPRFEAWATAELERAIEHWRRHFRGQARIKLDREVTEQDIATSHLVLWGDPGSNELLGRVADRLPIRWGDDAIHCGTEQFAADKHALLLVYPNPLNPRRYVVLNSSFTFRDFAYLNNARQVPKLPDWAIVDLDTPPDSLWPGKIVAANFFDEQWQVKE